MGGPFPAGWQIARVNSGATGSLSIGTPQEVGPQSAALSFHWQDVHNINAYDQESGPWYFSNYHFSVTLIGPEGTWPD